MKRYIRHGDVVLHPVDNIKGKKVNDKNSYVLALGEATGHHHTIMSEQLLITKHKGRTFISGLDAELVHQQHKPLHLNAKYVQVQEREIDHFAQIERKVID